MGRRVNGLYLGLVVIKYNEEIKKKKGNRPIGWPIYSGRYDMKKNIKLCEKEVLMHVYTWQSVQMRYSG